MATTTKVLPGLEWLAEEERAERERIAAQDGDRVAALRARQSEQRRAERARLEGGYRGTDGTVLPEPEWLTGLERIVQSLTA